VASRRRSTRWLISILAAAALAGGGWCLVARWAPRPAAGVRTTEVHTDRAQRTPAPRWQPGTLPGGREQLPPARKPEGAFVPRASDQPRAPDDGPGPYIRRYGGRTGRLAANRTPGPVEVKVEVTSTGKQPELLVWLPTLRVGETGTTIHARLRPAPDDRPRPVAEIAVVEGAEQIPGRFRVMSALDGQAGGDGAEFESRYVPERQPPLKQAGAFTPPPRAIRYLVRVRGQLGGEPFERTAGGIFYLHRPGGQLAPDQLRVARDGGDLVVTTDAVIERPGTYWAYAELWGQGNSGAGEQPVAFARERLPNLPAGRHPVRLLFGGLVIRDSGVDGPYVVRNLRFQQVDTHPPHESPPRAALPPTPGWKAAEFR
jgi:hypothetical protein